MSPVGEGEFRGKGGYKSPYTSVSVQLCNGSPWIYTSNFACAEPRKKGGGEATSRRGHRFQCDPSMLDSSPPTASLPHSSLPRLLCPPHCLLPLAILLSAMSNWQFAKAMAGSAAGTDETLAIYANSCQTLPEHSDSFSP